MARLMRVLWISCVFATASFLISVSMPASRTTAQVGTPTPSPAILAAVPVLPTATPSGAAAPGAADGGITLSNWFNQPRSAPTAQPVCPGQGQWLLLYWGGATTMAIAMAARTCPNADTIWTFASSDLSPQLGGPRWLGFRPSVPEASDQWEAVVGQAHFIHGGAGAVIAPAGHPSAPSPTAAFAQSQTQPSSPSPRQTGTVVRVVDGNTIEVLLESGTTQRIALLGVNAPAYATIGRPVECYGPESATRLRELVLDRPVQIERDPAVAVVTESVGIPAYVFRFETNINEQMIKEGFAREAGLAAPYRYQSQFRLAEQEAQANGRGIWTACRDSVFPGR